MALSFSFSSRMVTVVGKDACPELAATVPPAVWLAVEMPRLRDKACTTDVGRSLAETMEHVT